MKSSGSLMKLTSEPDADERDEAEPDAVDDLRVPELQRGCWSPLRARRSRDSRTKRGGRANSPPARAGLRRGSTRRGPPPTVSGFGEMVFVVELVRRLVDREADDGARGVLGVAVLVELERAEQAVRDVRLEQLRDHVGPRAVRAGDRVEQDLCRLCAVDRVRVDRGCPGAARLEAVDEFEGAALELVDRALPRPT